MRLKTLSKYVIWIQIAYTKTVKCEKLLKVNKDLTNFKIYENNLKLRKLQ